jgi:hypothetical protein
MKSNSENLEYLTENFELKKENDRQAEEGEQQARHAVVLLYPGKNGAGAPERAARERVEALHLTPLAIRRSGGHADEL